MKTRIFVGLGVHPNAGLQPSFLAKRGMNDARRGRAPISDGPKVSGQSRYNPLDRPDCGLLGFTPPCDYCYSIWKRHHRIAHDRDNRIHNQRCAAANRKRP